MLFFQKHVEHLVDVEKTTSLMLRDISEQCSVPHSTENLVFYVRSAHIRYLCNRIPKTSFYIRFYATWYRKACIYAGSGHT